MNIKDIPVPEIYKESADFRFFMKWFDYALTKTQYDTANMMDLYDPLRCPKDLLWLLGDTMGFRYDNRGELCEAFNRFVMLYFMSLIRYKGSKTGVTLAAEVNLKQKDINAYGEENSILYSRLEDTSIPVNSVYVESNVDEGYITVVYFTDEKPVDACIEYVRPLGMYCFQQAGVRIDSVTKISVDARLANATDSLGSIGPTRVGHLLIAAAWPGRDQPQPLSMRSPHGTLATERLVLYRWLTTSISLSHCLASRYLILDTAHVLR